MASARRCLKPSHNRAPTSGAISVQCLRSSELFRRGRIEVDAARKESGMKSAIFAAAVALALAPLAAPSSAEAKGCLKGALVGGVAGHYAGHHGVLGAIGGCVVGHHIANEKNKEAAPAKHSANQTNGD